MAISFSGFDNPFGGSGVDLQRKVLENEAKANAYNALRAMYGDQVGNLDWGQAQSAYGAQQKLPGELEAQGLKNQSARQENAFNEALNPMKLEKSRLDLDFTRQTQPTAIQGAQEQLRTRQLANQKTQAGMSDDEAERKRTVITGVVAAIKDRIARGEDPAKVFDEVAPQIAAMGGIDPAALRAQRDALVRDPAGTVKAWDQAIGAAWPNADAARTANSAAKLDLQERALKLKEQKQNPPVTEAGVAGVLSRQEHVGNTLDALLGPGDRGGLVDRVTDSTFLRMGHGLTDKLGVGTLSSDETEYRTALQSLVAGLGLDELQALKAKGVGLGSVTEAEHKLLQASVSRLQNAANRNPQEVKRDLIELRERYRRYNDALMRDLQAKPGGMDALRAVRGDRAPAPAQGAASGGLSPERQRALGDKYGF